MDVTVKYKGKWVKANITFNETLNVANHIIEFKESQITDYIKMTHIGHCDFRGDIFSTYVPIDKFYAHELKILFGTINHLYSKK